MGKVNRGAAARAWQGVVKQVATDVNGTGFSKGSASSVADVKKTAMKAAYKFVDVLQNTVASRSMALSGLDATDGGLGETAVEAASDVKVSAPRRLGARGSRKNQIRYAVGVYYPERELRRPSLYPQGKGKKGGYPPVDNIIAILNNGYWCNNHVYGFWHGNDIASLSVRTGSDFIEEAVRTFKRDYAKKYYVERIEVNDIYNMT